MTGETKRDVYLPNGRWRDFWIRGFIYLSGFERFSAFRGVQIVFSNNIYIEGIITIDPPYYSIYIGQSKKISIRNFKTFSTRGWSDGIDMMSSWNIEIDDVFLRTSDDCIAIYGHRWDFYGDSRNTFYNITCNGSCENSSRIKGYDKLRVVDGVMFENVILNGKPVLDAGAGNMSIGEYANKVVFKKSE